MKPRRPRTDAETLTVLPKVVAIAGDDDRLALVVDGRPRSEPVPRAELGGALARIAAEAAGPIRVEVREPNGISYADIIEPPDDADASGGQAVPVSRTFSVSYEGFLPGEEILIAVVDRIERADADGRLTLTTAPRPRSRRERRTRRDVIVFGSTSGTTIVGAID